MRVRRAEEWGFNSGRSLREAWSPELEAEYLAFVDRSLDDLTRVSAIKDPPEEGAIVWNEMAPANNAPDTDLISKAPYYDPREAGRKAFYRCMREKEGGLPDRWAQKSYKGA